MFAITRRDSSHGLRRANGTVSSAKCWTVSARSKTISKQGKRPKSLTTTKVGTGLTQLLRAKVSESHSLSRESP